MLAADGYDCTTCQADPELRDYRGCGEPPKITWRANGELHEGEWSPEWFARYAEEIETDPTPDLAEGFFEPAAKYFLRDVAGGELWPWCPMWFAQFAPDDVRHAAATCIDYHRAEERGSLASRASVILPWVRSTMDLARHVDALKDRERHLDAMTPEQRAKYLASERDRW